MGLKSWLFDKVVVRRLPEINVRVEDLGDEEYNFFLYTPQGAQVGQMSAAVLRRDGHVYVRHIEVFDEFLRNRYGTSAVVWLARRYNLPLVPVREAGNGPVFWSTMRSWSGRTMRVLDQVSQTDFRLIFRQENTECG